MPPVRSSPGVLRERLFLAFGLGSALVLVLAALAGGGDPESAGRAELVSTAARIAEAVKVEWKDWPKRVDWDTSNRAGWDRCRALVKPLLEWKEGELPYIEGRELVREPGAGHEVFDALFAQSEQVELAKNDPKGALELVLEALQKTEDPARRAEARLRAVQLAAKADPTHVVLEQYQLACSELDGSERKGNVSYRLLLALAAAKTLEDEHTDVELAEGLHALEASHKLAWVMPPLRFVPPSDSNEEWQCAEDPSTQAMLGLIQTVANSPWSFSGQGTIPVLGFGEEFEHIRTGQALQAEFGSVPASQDTKPSLRRARRGFLAFWNDNGLQQGGFASDETIRSTFDGCVASAAIVPESFLVDIDPPASKAKAVREHDALDGDFGFTVKHEDPEGWIKRSAVKQRFFRGALLVLALLSAAAGVATFRALRRERTLAELKTDFVANVSHELRTPLASILLLSENLESGRVTGAADQARYHTLIRREALRLRRLVDDVLDFSRLERGKRIDIRREPLRVDAWLERTCEELADWAREHALELAIERSPTEAEAEIDAEALRRALLNLLDNARKHSGGTKVELSALREGRELVLRVRDHGHGIQPTDRERVFEPFTRLSGGEAPGAGLGLSIVREIAREHGGTVRALDPAGGPGIVFEMRIPLAEETVA
jgi:signal transduction histidine kinase